MKTLNLLSLPLLALSLGCAGYRGMQKDISIKYDPTTGKITERREIVTDLKASAQFSSKQDLSRFSAIQTDKSQSFNGAGMSQHGATNAVEVLKQATKMIEAANPK